MKWSELAQARETLAELQEEARKVDAWVFRLTGRLDLPASEDEASALAQACPGRPPGGW